MTQAGPPPVGPSRAVAVPQDMSAQQRNYLAIVEVLKGNNGAEAKAIRAMLGGDKAMMDRFLATTFSLLAKQSDLLYRATPASIVQSIKDAASLGLVPMTDDGAIIERGGVASFNPMWRGILKRIRNSGQVEDVDVQLVYENDDFSYELGTNAHIHHVPARGDRGNYSHAYAFAVMKSGRIIPEVMSVAEINAVRDQFSRASKAGTPWATSWGEMARKTVLRRLGKRLPASAVEEWLAIEQRNDVAEQEAAKQLASVTDELAEVRALALRAVSGEPIQDDPQAAQEEQPGNAAPAQDAAPVEALGTAVDPGVDPNVAAAMALTAEQEQLARIRQKR